MHTTSNVQPRRRLYVVAHKSVFAGVLLRQLLDGKPMNAVEMLYVKIVAMEYLQLVLEPAHGFGIRDRELGLASTLAILLA